MLQRVKIDGIDFPRLYIAEDRNDVRMAMENGLPFVKWKYGMTSLVKLLLRPSLEKMFPGIDWDKVLGKKRRFTSNVYLVPPVIDEVEIEVDHFDKDQMLDAQLEWDDSMPLARAIDDEPASRPVDIATDSRVCQGGRVGNYEDIIPDKLPIADYVGDLSSSVDIDALMKLGLLPKFLGDIVDCIRTNLSNNMRWTEGYTKKLGYPLGRFGNARELPNLIIIDVSHSIPDGIAATMLTVADTLREACNAELIITSERSGYYPRGAELPSPQALRDYYGRSNESIEFMAILKQYIAGREFGHVFCFGDNDNPGSLKSHKAYGGMTVDVDMQGTKVHQLHSFPTTGWCETPGYCRWVKQIDPMVDEIIDRTWCKVMKEKYRM